ncbi:MAG: riboflavin synthase, partial [Nitrospira sp.]
IPHTAKMTTLSIRQVGETVNLESDVIGKYVARLLEERGQLPPKSDIVIDREYLRKRGLI